MEKQAVWIGNQKYTSANQNSFSISNDSAIGGGFLITVSQQNSNNFSINIQFSGNAQYKNESLETRNGNDWWWKWICNQKQKIQDQNDKNQTQNASENLEINSNQNIANSNGTRLCTGSDDITLSDGLDENGKTVKKNNDNNEEISLIISATSQDKNDNLPLNESNQDHLANLEKSKNKQVIFDENDFLDQTDAIYDDMNNNILIKTDQNLQNELNLIEALWCRNLEKDLKDWQPNIQSESSNQTFLKTLSKKAIRSSFWIKDDIWNQISVENNSNWFGSNPPEQPLSSVCSTERQKLASSSDPISNIDSDKTTKPSLNTEIWKPLNKLWSELNQENIKNSENLLVSEIVSLNTQITDFQDWSDKDIKLQVLIDKLQMLIHFKNTIELQRMRNGMPPGFEEFSDMIRDMKYSQISSTLIRDIKKRSQLNIKQKKKLRSNWKSSVRFFLKGKPLNTEKLFSDYLLN